MTNQEIKELLQIFEESGVAWFAASDGLYRYDGYVWQRFSVEHGLPSVFVRSVHVARDGRLWVGTDRGVGVFAGEHFQAIGNVSQLAGPSVRRIVEDADGTLWFCHDSWPDHRAPSGLTRYAAGEWTRYRNGAELPRPEPVLNRFRSSAGDTFLFLQNPQRTPGLRFAAGRWQELRPVTPQEIKATTVLSMSIEEGSAKVRSGPPKDDAPDYDWPVWAGVVPVQSTTMNAQPDPALKLEVTMQDYLLDLSHAGLHPRVKR